MKLTHEIALAPSTQEKLDRATLTTHHAVHDAGRMIAAGLVIVGVCVIVAAIIRRGKGD